MSLKAKLEAVIYAAEEPVTMAQLAMLFGNEALEWKAEQEAARASEAAQNAEAAADPVNAEFDYVDTTNVSAEEPVTQPFAAPEQPAEAAPEAAEESSASAQPAEQEPAEEAAAEPSPADADAEFKRAARQRDREVRTILRQVLDEIIASYATDGRGIEIREIAGGFRMATKPEFHDAVRAFIKSQKPPLKLSLPALETLAVIAYKQPVTAPEVNEIRGVDSSGVFGSLLARKLIATAGRKQVIGRPILYKTTKEFLMRFGLKDVSELPSMEEFEKMAASELDDMAQAEPDTEAPLPAAPELDENASEDEEGVTAAPAAPQSEAEPTAPEPPEPQPESNPSESAPPSAE